MAGPKKGPAMKSKMAAQQADDVELGASCPKRPRPDPVAGQPPPMTPHQAAGENKTVAREDVQEIQKALEGGVVSEAASKIMETLDKARLDIAVVGKPGSGKSSFINAIRGLENGDDGAAPLEVVTTTAKPTPYPHPKHPNVTVWDLPRMGPRQFQPSTYLEQVNFSRYDFFILIDSKRFKPKHAQLAREIQKRGKCFYLVRTNIEADLIYAQRWTQDYDRSDLLDQIQDRCEQYLQAKGIHSPNVFLLSSWHPFNFDFIDLVETMGKELPRGKRHAFLLALPNVSLEVVDMKKEALQKQIWKWAVLSCGVAAVPIPGLSIACDVGILMKAVSQFRQSFGLDDESLARLAKQVVKPVEEIKGVIRSPLAREISWDQMVKLLTKVVCGALLEMESLGSILPVFGPLVNGGISFGKIYYLLRSSLNEVAEDAERALNKAFDCDV